ncbi:hypothetical protein [Kocuria sabuli]|uniref:hypothetical protein n=1 Tax=Kocuria sabuli TaxID=3071448 RepID=UPI0034D7A7DD
MTASHFCHGFTDMSRVKNVDPMLLGGGEGTSSWDARGRQHPDPGAGLRSCNIGHGRTGSADAACQQMTQLKAYRTFGDHPNAPIIEALSDRISALAPFPDTANFCTGGDRDITDGANKLVRRYREVR